ncbi:Uma2 family endonuclease [Pannus brasiliensis CCIBt3594]|uniref:Uma2 family endonuclease n=1 Tax=Pannus brasiliensis CCIBt3594 TaxID=1427578 RepID=A0AAW9QW73_9CHRO
MSIAGEKRHYTREEYLQREETAEYKSEYRDGEIIPMTGATSDHNAIVVNFCSRFKMATRGRGYRIFVGDMRLAIPRYGFYTYPDLMLVRERPIYENDRKTILVNPTVIVEVLSRSTRNYDRGDKFDYYRSIPSFEEYILIDQYRSRVEQFSKRSSNEWLLREIEGEGAILNLSSIEFTLSLSEIYEEVEFSGEEG